MKHKVLVARMLVVLAGAMWLGGLTFYASVVIPTASAVLGSHTTAGFITRRVTEWINVLAAGALVVFLWHLIATRQAHRGVLRLGLGTTWAVMAGLQMALFVLHPMLDRLLDPEAMEILEPARFYRLHQVYLIATSVQLLAGLVFLMSMLAVWRRQDMVEPDRVAPRPRGQRHEAVNHSA